MLRAVLCEKNMSLYQLEKSSHISHATLNDIYNEKCNIENCSISTMSKIAKFLDLSLDSLYNYLTYQDLSIIKYDEDFDLFKSNTLQTLKHMDEKTFVNQLVYNDDISILFNNKEYSKSLYLLSLLDYLSKKNNMNIEYKYNEMRNIKLNKLYVSKSIYLLLLTKTIRISDVFKDSIDIFSSHNILEADISNVI